MTFLHIHRGTPMYGVDLTVQDPYWGCEVPVRVTLDLNGAILSLVTVRSKKDLDLPTHWRHWVCVDHLAPTWHRLTDKVKEALAS